MSRIVTTIASTVSGRIAELQRLDEAVRRPLPLSTRVGFVGVGGGVGCSVAAGLVAAVLAARRSHRVLAVNASPSPRSLLWHAGLALNTPATSSPEQDLERASARRSDQATAGLAVTLRGLHCLDLYSEQLVDGRRADNLRADDLREDERRRDERWRAAVAPAARFFDFVLTDWGTRDQAGAAAVAAASRVVCVVTAADRTSLQRDGELAQSIEDAGVGVLLAVVHTSGRAATAKDLLRSLPVPAVGLCHDRAHGAASPVPSTRMRAATNLAALRLAAAIVDAAATRIHAADRTSQRQPA